MPSFPKNSPYRNRKLLDLAERAPHCMYCEEPNRGGNIVSCHSNSQKHGKGMGTKAHDIPCYLCEHCHALADGRLGADQLDRRDREMIIYEGGYNTFLWLLQEGWLEVK